MRPRQVQAAALSVTVALRSHDTPVFVAGVSSYPDHAERTSHAAAKGSMGICVRAHAHQTGDRSRWTGVTESALGAIRRRVQNARRRCADRARLRGTRVPDYRALIGAGTSDSGCQIQLRQAPPSTHARTGEFARPPLRPMRPRGLTVRRLVDPSFTFDSRALALGTVGDPGSPVSASRPVGYC